MAIANELATVRETLELAGYDVSCSDGVCKAKMKIGVNRAYKVPREKMSDEMLDKTGGSEYSAIGLYAETKGIDAENKTVDFIASTDSPDRAGDIVEQEGWELDNFKKNPVFLFIHDSRALPVGKVIAIDVVDNKLMIRVKFADGDELASKVFSLVQQGVLNAVSVGFLPIEFEFMDPDLGFFGPRRFKRQELLEVSIVPVPANPEALVVGRSATTGVMQIPDMGIRNQCTGFGGHKNNEVSWPMTKWAPTVGTNEFDIKLLEDNFEYDIAPKKGDEQENEIMNKSIEETLSRLASIAEEFGVASEADAETIKGIVGGTLDGKEVKAVERIRLSVTMLRMAARMMNKDLGEKDLTYPSLSEAISLTNAALRFMNDAHMQDVAEQETVEESGHDKPKKPKAAEVEEEKQEEAVQCDCPDELIVALSESPSESEKFIMSIVGTEEDKAYRESIDKEADAVIQAISIAENEIAKA